MGNLRIGVSSSERIHASVSLLPSRKPTIEIGENTSGKLRCGRTSILTIHASSALLPSKTPTVEAGDSDNGSLRVNVNPVKTIHASSVLLSSKKPTVEMGKSRIFDVLHYGLTNWMVVALSNDTMEQTVRGKRDGAVYVVWDDAGTRKITIPTVDFGGDVSYVRGVYTESTEGNWQGFWAYMYDGGSAATNYYSSHAIVSNTCQITLTSSLSVGTRLQVYYVYETGQVAEPLTAINSYPSTYRCYNGAFPAEVTEDETAYGYFSAAVDSEEMLVVACWEAWLALSDTDCKAFAETIIAALRLYDVTTILNFVDDMEYDLGTEDMGWYFTVGDSAPTTVIVADPYTTGNKVMKITSNASSYSIVGKIGTFSVNSSTNFKCSFYGRGDGTFILAELCNDAGKSDAIDKRFYYVFPDSSLYRIDHTFLITKFRSKKNVVYSDLALNGWGEYGGATALYLFESVIVPQSIDGVTHYYNRHLRWDFTFATAGQEYAGTYVTIPNPADVDSGDYANLNFYVYLIGSTGQTELRIIIRDDEGIQFATTTTVSASGRKTLTWASFAYYSGGTGLETLTHPIDQVFFELDYADLSIPISGDLVIYDIKFGSHDWLASYNLSLWQLRLPTGSRTVYIDDTGFDYTLTDDYAGCPFFSAQWSSKGQNTWQGPTYAGYIIPAAYYFTGYTAEALVQVDFLKDAQDGYYNWYSGTPWFVQAGPFLPVHTRQRPENVSYGDQNTFTWGSPNSDTNWGGYNYRGFAQIAHYYYLTGNTDAYNICVNWINWIDAQATEDGDFPSAPKGYLIPTDFTIWTGYWTNGYSPDMHALVVQACIYLYWRSGNAKANTWYRRLLDDLITNRVDSNGSYPQPSSSLTYGFHQGEVGKALGMLINGRQGGVVNYSLSATAGDTTAFEDLYSFCYNDVGTIKPCMLSEDWLPLHQREVKTFSSNERKWVSDNVSLSEDISICMAFAVDYAVYDSSSYGTRWLEKFKEYLLEAL